MRPTQAKRLFLREQNAKHGPAMKPVLREDWPTDMGANPPEQVWRSRDYLALVYVGLFETPWRVSVCRTDIDQHGRWKQDIPWDDLQRIKNEIGFKDSDAVEVYPREFDVVNVANMRHLWIVNSVPFAWRRK